MKIPFWPDFKGYRNIELGLDRVYQLLERLNNPQNNLPPTIHVAGTNGKGSTISFLKTILQEAGYSTHIYTSPHLVNFNERIILANEEIDDEFLSKCLSKCQEAANQEPKIDVTFFEGITVAAFLAFSNVNADILLLETGMGGRLDATNILSNILCSIITPIAFDHTDFLGDTLEKIAHEKAGIIKNNCPVIIANQEDSALNAIKKQADITNSSTIISNQDWHIKINENGFNFIGFNQEISLPKPSLIGTHQIHNAATAIATIFSQTKFKVTNQQIKSALTKTAWPARLQKVNSQIYLDGSHNTQGAQVIKEFLLSKKDHKKFIIFSMLKDKDCEGFLNIISPEIDQLIITKIPNEPNSLNTNEIQKIADNNNIENVTKDNLEEIFNYISSQTDDKENTLILICGSLYFAGHFLGKYNQTSKS